ncbi:enoyl-CoA hydratase/isomerase family protein [Parvibium lacunae]|uniref:Enoyl-CoA hydratase/isomerase family protein n=1 Tax=Parvibium lacunae TaxID=1888893 RepID=A0A368L4U0_9BURK|nr:enoyl-CoA hydratase/isomerase family protein [Parvibium lacunae]RCS58587.1 enoyl-CoA hydratase/isomerase family protein [Parvibium lacunae]
MGQSNFATLLVEHIQEIGVIWLNRPEQKNAFNDQMIADLHQAILGMQADQRVRAVVLAAKGDAFCAGADLAWMRRMADADEETNRQDAQALADMLHAIYICPKPVIARVHGHTFGGGVGLVAACDIAVAQDGLLFALSEAKLGLIPATISPYVINAIGPRMAHRYFLTAERFSASEAHRIQLVHAVTSAEELDDAIDSLLNHILLNGPHAVAQAKQLIQMQRGRELDDTLRAETAQHIAQIRRGPEAQEGIRAFLEKRKPSWVPKITG